VRTHEEVVGVGVGAANLEQLHEVVELTVDITADGDRAFLEKDDQSRYRIPEHGSDLRQAERWIPPGELLAPVQCSQYVSHARCAGQPAVATPQVRPSGATKFHRAHLIAKSLHIDLRQLLAVHEALDPAVEGGDRCWLSLHRRQIGRRPPDILHIGVHRLLFSSGFREAGR
jgi:hypothetical protein